MRPGSRSELGDPQSPPIVEGEIAGDVWLAIQMWNDRDGGASLAPLVGFAASATDGVLPQCSPGSILCAEYAGGWSRGATGPGEWHEPIERENLGHI